MRFALLVILFVTMLMVTFAVYGTPEAGGKTDVPSVSTRADRIEAKIRVMAEDYGLDPDQAVMIAQCESGLDERARNPVSSAKGIYQFTDGTWEEIKARGHQFDADENIKQFMIWFPIYPQWWVCE